MCVYWCLCIGGKGQGLVISRERPVSVLSSAMEETGYETSGSGTWMSSCLNHVSKDEIDVRNPNDVRSYNPSSAS